MINGMLVPLQEYQQKAYNEIVKPSYFSIASQDDLQAAASNPEFGKTDYIQRIFRTYSYAQSSHDSYENEIMKLFNDELNKAFPEIDQSIALKISSEIANRIASETSTLYGFDASEENKINEIVSETMYAYQDEDGLFTIDPNKTERIYAEQGQLIQEILNIAAATNTDSDEIPHVGTSRAILKDISEFGFLNAFENLLDANRQNGISKESLSVMLTDEKYKNFQNVWSYLYDKNENDEYVFNKEKANDPYVQWYIQDQLTKNDPRTANMPTRTRYEESDFVKDILFSDDSFIDRNLSELSENPTLNTQMQQDVITVLGDALANRLQKGNVDENLQRIMLGAADEYASTGAREQTEVAMQLYTFDKMKDRIALDEEGHVDINSTKENLEATQVTGEFEFL